MACRCPVVSTRVGGPSDTVEEGVNGFLVDAEDSAGLARNLAAVLTLGESEWKRMSDAALATALRYTWDDATGLLESALLDVIGNARSLPADTVAASHLGRATSAHSSCL
jgi:glycosyltransferase involved in cell wall biosynthesis